MAKALRKEARGFSWQTPGPGCRADFCAQVHYTVDEKQRQCVLIEVGLVGCLCGSEGQNSVAPESPVEARNYESGLTH